jgi:hypothetical protein
MKLSHLRKCGGFALLGNGCRSFGLGVTAMALRRASTAQIGPRLHLNLTHRDKVLLIATPLLAGVALRIALDAMADPASGPGLSGQNIFGFALIPAMIGLLIYALRSREVLIEAKPKNFGLTAMWRRFVQPVLGGCWSAVRLTGWTQRAPWVFGKLLLERAWHSKRWRQSLNFRL